MKVRDCLLLQSFAVLDSPVIGGVFAAINQPQANQVQQNEQLIGLLVNSVFNKLNVTAVDKYYSIDLITIFENYNERK
jgi:hypothetical protein